MVGVLLVACTSVGRAILIELCTNPDLADVKIAGVVNLNNEIAASKSNYDSFADLILTHRVPIHYCTNINDQKTIEWMRSKEPDLIIQSGWSQKFSAEVLSIPRLMCIGEHPSPLPRGRGAACLNWAILNGEYDWGDSYFKMEDHYDVGGILAQESFELTSYDDISTAYTKVAKVSRTIIRENIRRWLNGEFNISYQDESKATYFKRRRPEDGHIDFSVSAERVSRLIRAVTKPYPGAFFMDSKSGDKIYVWRAQLAYLQYFAKPSQVVGSTTRGGILVGCGDGVCVELLRVQRDTGEEEWAADWYENRKFLTVKLEGQQ